MKSILLIMVVALLATITACADDTDRPLTAEERAIVAEATTSDVREVSYHVSGDASSVSITISTPTGTQQASNRSVPLISTTSGRQGIYLEMGAGEFAYISAQNEDSIGSITCTIRVDGKVISQNTSTGGYAIASCEGTVR